VRLNNPEISSKTLLIYSHSLGIEHRGWCVFIFAILSVFFCLVSTPVLANTGQLTGKLNVDDAFSVYLSTDDGSQGVLLGSGNDWSITESIASNLTQGQDYYLHIHATDLSLVAGFLGEFTLTGHTHQFENGGMSLLTDTSNWRVSTSGWSNYQPASDYGQNSVGPWGAQSGVDSNARWIWSSDNNSDNTNYFTTKITAANSCDTNIGKLDAYGIKIGSGGSNVRINNTTEALAIHAAWLAAGSPTSGLISGGTYNIIASGSSKVDRIDFGGSNHDFSGTLPYPGAGVSGSDFLVHASGTLSLPKGDYTIYVESDDGFSFVMDTLSGDIATFNKFGGSTSGASNELRFENPTGNSNTGGSFTLTQDSVFDIAAIFFERGGGDYLEISIANNIRSNAAPSGYQILRDGALNGKVKFGQCSTPSPLLEYRFDESSWDGTAGELIDSGINGLGGQSSGGPLSQSAPQNAQLCKGATFDGVDDHFSLPPIATDFSSGLSAMAWVDFNNVQSWERVFDFSNGAANDNIVMARNGTSNSLTFEIYNGGASCGKTTSSNAIVPGRHHYAVTLSPEKAVVLYRDGVVIGSGTSSCLPTNVTRSVNYIGRSPWGHDDYFERQIDEFKVFDSTLSSPNITDIYNNEYAGNNYDGTVRDCGFVPVAEYRFDEPSWNGTTNEVLDNTGQGLNGNAVGDTNTIAAGQICRAGTFDGNGDYVRINGINSYLNTTASLSFWIKSTQTGSDIPWRAPGISGNEHRGGRDDVFWGYLDASGHIRIAKGNKSPAVSTTRINDDSWHHVVLTRNSQTGVVQVFVDGHLEDSAISDTGDVSKRFSSIGRIDGSFSSQNFIGQLDEVLIYDFVISETNISTIYANQLAKKNYDGSSRDCANASVIDHFQISHDGNGLTCEAENISIKACMNSDCTSLSSEAVTLDFQAESVTKSTVPFIGSTVVNLSQTTPFIGLTLGIINPSITPTNPLVCKEGSALSCDIDFTDAGFRFLNGGSGFSETITNQEAGTSFDIRLQAVKNSNGVCTGLFNGNKNVDLSQENVAPNVNGGLSFSVNGSNIAKYSSVTNTTLNFGANSMADITAIYHDAGQISLHADYEVGGVSLTGSSNTFWVSPAKLVVSAKSGSTVLTAATPTATPTHKAGDDFELTVSAYNSLDVITPNYLPGQIQFKLARTGPTLSVSVDGNLTYANGSALVTSSGSSLEFNNVTLSDFISGVSSYSTANYSEVGLINLDLQDSDYGGESITIDAEAINIGRFIPHHFEQTIAENGSFLATCNTGTTFFAYSGQKDEATESIGAISYLTNPVLKITALNKQGDITQNYYQDSQDSANDFMKLSAADVIITSPTLDQEAVGVDGNKLPLTANMNTGTLSQNDLTALPNVIALDKGVLHYELSDVDNFFYNRSANALVAPFISDIDFSVFTIKDSDDVNVTTTDDASPTGVWIRFGRLVLENSFGPETSNLPQPMKIEHFDGDNYIISSNNNCVNYDASKLTLTNKGLDPALTNKQGGTGSFSAGKTRAIELKAPGAENQGQIGVSYQTFDWLKFDWNSNGTYIDPTSVATFGVYRGNDRVIYWREVFN
jgi:MSHA biogenesis protein MshQ